MQKTIDDQIVELANEMVEKFGYIIHGGNNLEKIIYRLFYKIEKTGLS